MRLSITPLITIATIAAIDLSGNATVSALSGRVTDTETDIGTAQGNITTLINDVGDIETDVGTLQSDVTTVQSAATALQADVLASAGAPVSIALAEKTGVTDTELTGNFVIDPSLTLVANRSYKLDVKFNVLTALRARVAQVSVEGAVLRYVPAWDTTASYVIGDMVIFSAAGNKKFWRCIQNADATIDDPATATAYWTDKKLDGSTALGGTGSSASDPFAWYSVESGAARAAVDTGYATYFATTDADSDGIADNLPYISSHSGNLGYGMIVLNAQVVWVSADGVLVDLGVNH